ncbi:MAG: DNA polymerase III subunit delta [Scytolyngbya sp. HA4215-MV1]|nr:DNA polymerase III subunit delta [Scytolyngbya sp. HA4215-MV1]
MPIYLYWGDDEFAIARAVAALRQQVLDPTWESFNYDKLSAEQPDAMLQSFNQAMTPPFGTGGRLVWLMNTTLVQRCSEELLAELERTLPAIPDTSTLLLTAETKPDGRLKSTKLLQKHAEIREFSLIPPWKTELLVKQVRQVAQELGVKLTADSVELLTEAVGSDTRQLYSELEKLRLYAGDAQSPLEIPAVSALVTTSSQTSLQLVEAVRQGKTADALALLADLLARNEAPTAIVATLISQFRQKLWVKLMIEAGERDDREIAQAAEVSNPKRIYFLRQEVKPLRLSHLQQALPLLLELDYGLKGGAGADPMETLQVKMIELCCLFQP